MSADKLPWFPFYPNDFLGGTAYMNDAEVGCYIRMLCYQWEKGAIPQEMMDLFLQSRGDDERERLRLKFEIQRGTKGELYCRNKRLDYERQASCQFKRGETQKASPKRKATPWPKDLKLTPKLKAYAEQKGVINPEEAWERFEARNKAKGSTYSNWEQAWYQWCLSPYQERAGIL